MFFRPLFAFFITELGSRRIVHVGVTRSPSDAWVAQQLREATPVGQAPGYLIRDTDAKYGPSFAAVAVGCGIEVLRTPVKAPQANALCERLLGSVRRECLDHILIGSEAHRRRVLKEDMAYFNRSRPHQGLQQRIPDQAEFVDKQRETSARSSPSPSSVARIMTTADLHRRDSAVETSADERCSRDKWRQKQSSEISCLAGRAGDVHIKPQLTAVTAPVAFASERCSSNRLFVQWWEGTL